MPKSDTWPGGVAMEPSSNLDSAGSRDSVISMNSGYSEDSMEHLTAEERACIMYLEETIEALEVQEDSGFSNDEPEAGLQADKTSHMRVNDISSFNTDESGGALTNGDKAGHHILQTPEPASSPAFDRKDLNTSMNLITQLNPPDTESVTDGNIHSELCISTDEDGTLKIVPSDSLSRGPSTGAPETDVGVIPPPSAFMDEPFKPPQPQKVNYLPPPAGIHNHQPGGTVDLEALRRRSTEKRSSQRSPVNKEPPNSPPELSLPAVSSGPPLSLPPLSLPPSSLPPLSLPPSSLPPSSLPPLSLPPLSLPPLSLPPSSLPPSSLPPSSLPPLSLPSLSLPPLSPPPLSPPAEAAEPRSPPAVAPRPKKLPSNIILKSHKTGYDGSSGASVSTSSDWHLSDPQRVRIEALRKLGLLPAEADSGPAQSPSLSPRTRKSWAAPPSPSSSAAPNTPPLTPSYIRVHSPPPASAPLQSPAAEPTAAPSTAAEVLLVPAAFSDSLEPPPSDNILSAVNTPPRTPPALVKHLTPPKAFKSASLERSLPGLSSYMASQESNKAGGDQSPSQLRNNRPRPASLGSGKEFIAAQRNGLHPGRVISKEPDLRKSLQAHNAFQHTGSSQKLPRSQGISVLICPRSENEEDRRDALKKLGLIRD
ncbi:vegetative cell wall protein gp1 [Notothenia coriiceps]|uniref:Vegetative cell wall protein gp1-like n=1 Tax=Notothenia coriiceps TaxID=8208 RepID=A0A6I9MNX3_9TELE|nr:PREDICTED: vegetative cell wall protein gp1-like [Notothenia coriiceps]XP_010766107.1 PREDICTED: vegetative cell wall protein gp1-like [Notothenia coriiceps]